MNMICTSATMQDYINPSHIINYHHPIIREKIAALFSPTQTTIEKIQSAFHFVRDDIIALISNRLK